MSISAPKIISLSPLWLVTSLTDATLGASFLWLETRTRAGGTAHGSMDNRSVSASLTTIDSAKFNNSHASGHLCIIPIFIINEVEKVFWTSNSHLIFLSIVLIRLINLSIVFRINSQLLLIAPHRIIASCFEVYEKMVCGFIEFLVFSHFYLSQWSTSSRTNQSVAVSD